MFEHRTHRLLPWRLFLLRILRSLGLALCVILTGLSIGALGYHFIARLKWIDAFHNGAMVLAGMGQIDTMPSDEAKIFATIYCLFAGLLFLTTATVLMSPVVHRIIHSVHLEMGSEEQDERDEEGKDAKVEDGEDVEEAAPRPRRRPPKRSPSKSRRRT